MSLDTVVKAISSNSEEELQKYSSYVLKSLSSGEPLASASDALKHKFKVRVSSLVKSNGSTRAYGAYLATVALDDWSVIASHGASWSQILLHVLDLPDAVSWAPSIRALTKLFVQVQGKQDLLRQVGTSKVPDFIKRLINLFDRIPAQVIPALSTVIQLYPGPTRQFEPKIASKLASQFTTHLWDQAALTYAKLPGLDKNPNKAWRDLVLKTLTDLDALLAGEDETALTLLEHTVTNEAAAKNIASAKLWKFLTALITNTPSHAVKLPSQRLLDTVRKSLNSLNAEVTLSSLEFLTNTYSVLSTVYLLWFEEFLNQLTETVKLGARANLASVKFATQLLAGAGWVQKQYVPFIVRIVRYSLRLAVAEKPNADGLADFVSDPASFTKPVSNDSIETVSQLLNTVIKTVDGLTNTVRAEIDAFLIKHKTAGLYAASLYPARYSILPLALSNGLDGFETLVHPRFPPLAQVKTSDTHMEDEEEEQIVEDEEMEIEPVQAEPEQVEEPEEPVKLELPVVEVEEPIQETLATLPVVESPIEMVQPVLETIPVAEPVAVPVQAQSLPEERPEKRPRIDENENDDDEDEFIMPVLNMDSD